jgi:hypothetical protein
LIDLETIAHGVSVARLEETRDSYAVIVQTHEPAGFRHKRARYAKPNPREHGQCNGSCSMTKFGITVALWLLGLAAAFIGFQIHSPYLAVLGRLGLECCCLQASRCLRC